MKGCAKNLFIGIGVIAVIIVIAAIASSGKKDSNSQTVSNPSSPATAQPAASATPTAADTITISHSVYKDSGYGTYEVDGEATNNDSVQHTATLKATFYDASGNILGTAEGAVDQIAPGDTKTFSLVGTDKVAGYASMKVQVDALL